MPHKIDFDKILISRSEKKALRKLQKYGLVELDKETFNYFFINDLVYQHGTECDAFGSIIPDGRCQLSETGKRFCLYRKAVISAKRIEWARYLITTAIAVAALIASVIALVNSQN